MSLDCYPLEGKEFLNLREQPLALETGYSEDLFISVVDECQTIAVFDLQAQKFISSFRIGLDVIIDEVVYSDKGDYIACIGHINGLLTVFTIFDWRNSSLNDNMRPGTSKARADSGLHSRGSSYGSSNGDHLKVLELNINVHKNESPDLRSKLTYLACCTKTGNLAVCCSDTILIFNYIGDDSNDTRGYTSKPFWADKLDKKYFCHMLTVRLSIWATQVKLAENYLAIASVDHVQVIKLELLTLEIDQQTEYINNSSSWSLNANKKQVTWNLNTKKLVKLPTLMQNTSSNLSSFHVCHPLELLGPASESIACRVSAPIYLSDYSQNQMEAIVMLCRQFDKGYVKGVSIQALYLSDPSELERLNISHSATKSPMSISNRTRKSDDSRQGKLLKSDQHKLIVSVTCVVTTLTSCFVYSMHGKKVIRSQTISHPDVCVDSRHDLLNMYILTSLGLQVCSTGVCDSVFRYDWSSSADLNLNFESMIKCRVLVTKHYVILIPSSMNNKCEVEYYKKPDLFTMEKRIQNIVNGCESISVRANLLTYLHANAQLQFIKTTNESNERINKILQEVTVMLCKQLLLKKQTNAITNSKIDRAIKHLLDTSKCDLDELIGKLQLSTCKSEDDKIGCCDADDGQNHEHHRQNDTNNKSHCLNSLDSHSDDDDDEIANLAWASDSSASSGVSTIEGDETEVIRIKKSQQLRRSSRNPSNEELIRIYSKMLEDLSANSTDDNSSFSASFMRRNFKS